MAELKLSPCPVCKTDEYIYVVPAFETSRKYICICNICGYNSDDIPHSTEEAAEWAWNRRESGE